MDEWSRVCGHLCVQDNILHDGSFIHALPFLTFNLAPGPLSSAPTLLSLWSNKMNSLASCRHEEFAGRLDAKGNQAELYGHMNVDSTTAR